MHTHQSLLLLLNSAKTSVPRNCEHCTLWGLVCGLSAEAWSFQLHPPRTETFYKNKQWNTWIIDYCKHKHKQACPHMCTCTVTHTDTHIQKDTHQIVGMTSIFCQNIPYQLKLTHNTQRDDKRLCAKFQKLLFITFQHITHWKLASLDNLQEKLFLETQEIRTNDGRTSKICRLALGNTVSMCDFLFIVLRFVDTKLF